jgi:hypothetical protein
MSMWPRSRAALTSAIGPPRSFPAQILVLSGLAALATSASASLSSQVEWRTEYLLSKALDVMSIVYLTGCLLSLQRRNWLGGLLAAMLANGLLVISGLKLAVLGASAFWSDSLLLIDLARAFGTGPTLLVGFLLAGVTTAFLLNLACRPDRRVLLIWAPLIIMMAGTGLSAVSPAIARETAAHLPLRIFDHPRYGHLGEAYIEVINRLDRQHGMLTAVAAGPPPQTLTTGATIPPLALRNIHIVVVESLIDPTWLTQFHFSREPLSPLFAQWRAGPISTSLSPVFGNRSSNAEFEVLCGVPAAIGPSDIIFRALPNRALDCLPRRLADQGFRSLSLVPNSRDFFRADAAYATFGFERRLFQGDLEMSDTDGAWLSAEATLRQALERITPLLDGTRPVLSYVFINAGHYPYDRNLDRRPDRVAVTPADPLVAAYVNAAHHNAIALEDYVGHLLDRDPTSLIVVLGDHPPLLGANFHGYRLGGRLPEGNTVMPLYRALMYETPLVILDAGTPLAVGRLPTYLLPEIILDRVSQGAYCRVNRCASRAARRLRPFRDYVLEVEAAGPGEQLCLLLSDHADPFCADAVARSRSWQRALFQLIDNTSLLEIRVE